MAIKLYLAKAFDKIEWHFIRNMLLCINVPQKLVNIIMSCISSSELAILINGNATNFFQSSRGVRQGDPLSPYLFILGMKFLSLLIHNQISNHFWTPIPITSPGPFISHTFFADDIFLFDEANVNNAKAITNVLDDFTHHSGLHINLKKSKNFFSSNCKNSISSNISIMLNIKQTSSLGAYLGFPLLPRNPKHSDFEPLLENLNSKMAKWKTKTLTLAGRVTLAKSVLNVIPTHIMQCLVLPSKTSETINRIVRNFIWGSSNEERKIHLLKWDTITLPKNLGGLQLRENKAHNLSLLGSLAWRFLTLPSTSIWTSILKSKYLSHSEPHPFTIPTANSKNSHIRKSLLVGWTTISHFIKWTIENGSKVRFWLDFWVNDTNLPLINSLWPSH